MNNQDQDAKFFVGQIVYHHLFDYRGVVVDVDASFQGTEQWYDEVARSHPPKDQPWYQVLVDKSTNQTYVAERNLVSDRTRDPIDHPKLGLFFNRYQGGVYLSKTPNH
ncbi:MAG: heat shock protein HspQ [Magnetococcales bacterium]|nr:heat shock protein HspQ [Magnetococcales bacterium]